MTLYQWIICVGGKSIAVPGEIKGYWEAHQKYGRVEWKRLFDGAIKLCEDGVVVSRPLARAISQKEGYIRNSTTLR